MKKKMKVGDKIVENGVPGTVSKVYCVWHHVVDWDHGYSTVVKTKEDD